MMFFVHLLFEEKCEMPQQSVMNEIMEKHLGKTECFSYYKLSACEPEEKLDRGWFTGPAGQALLIHSRTFGDYAAGKRE